MYPRHRLGAKQLLDFDGISVESMAPTDCDFFLDLRGKAFILGEVKYLATPVPRGQRVALERLAAACTRGGVPTLVLVVSHATGDGEDVRLADALVVEYYWKGAWMNADDAGTVKDVVESFAQKVL